MLNVIILEGRLTRDPELKEIGETSVANFDLAVDDKRKDENGEHTTSFIPVVAFGNLGELVSKYLHKGSKVLVRGYVQQRSWLNKEGLKRSVLEVILDEIDFLDPKEPEDEEPKFDSRTGKPLKPTKK